MPLGLFNWQVTPGWMVPKELPGMAADALNARHPHVYTACSTAVLVYTLRKGIKPLKETQNTVCSTGKTNR